MRGEWASLVVSGYVDNRLDCACVGPARDRAACAGARINSRTTFDIAQGDSLRGETWSESVEPFGDFALHDHIQDFLAVMNRLVYRLGILLV